MSVMGSGGSMKSSSKRSTKTTYEVRQVFSSDSRIAFCQTPAPCKRRGQCPRFECRFTCSLCLTSILCCAVNSCFQSAEKQANLNNS